MKSLLLLKNHICFVVFLKKMILIYPKHQICFVVLKKMVFDDKNPDLFCNN